MNDALARQCLRIVGELPREVSRRCLNYLALFRLNTGRGLTWGKALRVLSELRDLVLQAHIQWERNVARPNSAIAWGRALETVIERPPKQLPLTSHGYLRRIAYGFADEMDKEREKAENSAERKGRKTDDGRRTTALRVENLDPVRIDFEDMKGITDERFRKK